MKFQAVSAHSPRTGSAALHPHRRLSTGGGSAIPGWARTPVALGDFRPMSRVGAEARVFFPGLFPGSQRTYELLSATTDAAISKSAFGPRRRASAATNPGSSRPPSSRMPEWNDSVTISMGQTMILQGTPAQKARLPAESEKTTGEIGRKDVRYPGGSRGNGANGGIETLAGGIAPGSPSHRDDSLAEMRHARPAPGPPSRRDDRM